MHVIWNAWEFDRYDAIQYNTTRRTPWECQSNAVKYRNALHISSHYVSYLFRLLNSPSLGAVGLSVGYETWPSIPYELLPAGWLTGSNVDRRTTRMRYIIARLTGGKFSRFYLTVPLQSTYSRQMPAVRAAQADCGGVQCLLGLLGRWMTTECRLLPGTSFEWDLDLHGF